MRRIRAAEKASQAQQGIIVTVSEPELLLGPMTAHSDGFLQVKIGKVTKLP